MGRKASEIRLIWDDMQEPNGWFIRINCDDGQEIDSIIPGNNDDIYLDKEIDENTARKLVIDSLQWESLEASKSVIDEAIESWRSAR